MTVILHDTFTGSGALPDHTPETAPGGSSWVIRNFNFGQLSGGRLLSNSNTDAIANIDGGISDFELEGRLYSGNEGIPCFAARSNQTGTEKMRLGVYHTTGQILFGKPGNEMTVAAGVQANTDYWLRWWACGNHHYVWISTDRSNWTKLVDSYVEAANDYQTNTYFGVAAQTLTTTANWDEIEVSNTTAWKRYVALGDSTIGAVLVPGGWFYDAVYATESYRHWAHNVGHAGDSAYDQMPGQVVATQNDNADIVFTLFGRNMGSGTVEQSLAVYTAQLSELRADHPNATIYALRSFDSTSTWQTGQQELAFNATAAANLNGDDITYVDTTGWIDPATDTTDGTHPNAGGITKITAEIASLLSGGGGEPAATAVRLRALLGVGI